MIGCGDLDNENTLSPKTITISFVLPPQQRTASERVAVAVPEVSLKHIQTELILLAHESVEFTRDYLVYENNERVYDGNVTDFETSTVALEVPTNTPIKLFAYRFEEAIQDEETFLEWETEDMVDQYGTSQTFVITDTSEYIKLTINIFD